MLGLPQQTKKHQALNQSRVSVIKKTNQTNYLMSIFRFWEVPSLFHILLTRVPLLLENW